MNGKSLREIFSVYSALGELIREHSRWADVINAHNFPALWACGFGKPVVWMCNELPDVWHVGELGNASKALYRCGLVFDRVQVAWHRTIITVADYTMFNRALARYHKPPYVIPYGIDGSFFAEGETERDGSFTIIHPAIISPSKCQMETIEAAGTSDRIYLVGHDDSEYASLVKSEALRMRKDVQFTGQVGRGRLRDLYHKSNLAVFPGKGQGSWLGVFEAMAAGCPVIVSPNISCSTTVFNCNLGIVSDNLKEAVEEVKYDYNRALVRAARAQKYVLENMAWEGFGQKYETILELATK